MAGDARHAGPDKLLRVLREERREVWLLLGQALAKRGRPFHHLTPREVVEQVIHYIEELEDRLVTSERAREDERE